MSIRFRASKGKLCQVCMFGSKGCSTTDKGLHFCRGIDQNNPSPNGWCETRHGPDDNGFRHFKRIDDPPTKLSSRISTQPKPKPNVDWHSEAKKYSNGFNNIAKKELSIILRLPIEAFEHFALIGAKKGNDNSLLFTFPEYETVDKIIGITERYADGTKKMLKGGHRGLTIPENWQNKPGPVFIVEGASDTLAMSLACLNVIGRPSNTGGAELLAKLLCHFERDIVIVAENDTKENGQWPGREGAETVAKKLSNLLGRTILIAFPPKDFKDVRDWLTSDKLASVLWQNRSEIVQTELMKNPQKIEKSKTDTKQKEKNKHSATDLLISIGKQKELFHDSMGQAFVTFENKTTKVSSCQFRSWLTSKYYNLTGKPAHGEPLKTAINTLEAIAKNDYEEKPIFVRLGEHNSKILLSLSDAKGTVIQIAKHGWQIETNSQVRFISTSNADALPMPVRGGKISELRQFINCPDDDAFALLIGWITGCFIPNGPFLLLLLTGEQGSAKSTTGRILKELIDPEIVRDRSVPRDLRDFAIWANFSRLLCVDNVSHFPDWLSDGFCRLSTGGGFGTRTLYANEEETVFDARRPAILNGIEDFATRGDLLERSIILRHQSIPENKRQQEKKLWNAFENAKPRLLGAILDRISAGLRLLPNVDTSSLPRMADAVAFAIACEKGMNEKELFLEAFRQNQSESHYLMISDSPVVEPIKDLIFKSGGSWEGTATQLYTAIKPSGEKLPSSWPKKPSGLSGTLNRLAPALAECFGLSITNDRLNNLDRTRIIRMSIKGEKFCNQLSSASSASGTDSKTPMNRTSLDGQDNSFQTFSNVDISAIVK